MASALVSLLFFSAGCGATSAPARPVAARPAPSTAAASPLFASHATKVAEGIYAFIAPESQTGLVTGNSAVIVGDDGALVVDTGKFPSLARAQIEEIRRLTPQPVRYVVTTHWHGDHHFGNQAYREAYPGVVFVGHTETRRLALAHCPEGIEQQRRTGALLEQFRAIERTGTVDGKPIDDDDRRMLGPSIHALEDTLGDSEVQLVPTALTFERALTLHLGAREVRLLHLGRGNTAGDVVVQVPDARVVATGDLVVNPTPYGIGSYPAEWAASLRELEALGATSLIPGHGPVEHDTSYVETLIGLIDAVRTQVQGAVRDGLSLEEVRKRVDLAAWRRRLAGEDFFRGVAFDTFFVDPFVARAYQEAKGKLEDE